MNVDFDETYQGKVTEIIDRKITFFKVAGNKLKNAFEPMIFWLKTDDLNCHRFFIDAWTLHWVTYSEEEADEIIIPIYSSLKIRFIQLKKEQLKNLYQAGYLTSLNL